MGDEVDGIVTTGGVIWRAGFNTTHSERGIHSGPESGDGSDKKETGWKENSVRSGEFMTCAKERKEYTLWYTTVFLGKHFQRSTVDLSKRNLATPE